MSQTTRLQAALLAVASLVLSSAASAQTQSTPTPARPATAAQTTTASQPAQTPAATARPAAAGVRAEPVPPQVDAAFKAFDTDRNGSLSLAEFRSGWQTMRRSGAQTVQARLQQQFKQVDANGNGGIDRTEYSGLVLVKRAGSAAPPFSEFDRDGSQKLEYAEYAELVRRLGTAQTGTAPRK
jgi:glucose/arabinose dehydrogenase